jgi:hypothetical protein
MNETEEERIVGIPRRLERRARAMGSRIQPLLSLARGEGNPEENLTKLTLASSSKVWWVKRACWEREKGEEK